MNCNLFAIASFIISILIATYGLWLRKQSYKKSNPNHKITPIFKFDTTNIPPKSVVKLKITNESNVDNNIDKMIIYYYPNTFLKSIFKFYYYFTDRYKDIQTISKKCLAHDNIEVLVNTNVNLYIYKIEIIDKISHKWKVKWISKRKFKKLTYIEELKKKKNIYGENYIYKLGENYFTTKSLAKNSKTYSTFKSYSQSLEFFNKDI